MNFPEWKCMTFVKFSLKLVPNVRINNIPALVLIMACRRPRDMPLFESITVDFLTHIYVTQWVKIYNAVISHTELTLQCWNDWYHCKIKSPFLCCLNFASQCDWPLIRIVHLPWMLKCLTQIYCWQVLFNNISLWNLIKYLNEAIKLTNFNFWYIPVWT